MKKVICILIACLLLLGLSIPVLAQTQDNVSALEENTQNYPNGYFDFRLAKKMFAVDEKITLFLAGNTNNKILSINVSSNGFQYTEKAVSAVNSLPSYELVWNSDTDEAYFSCVVLTSNDTQYLCELFAVKCENTIYCSLDSFDAARDDYFFSKVEQGVWTQEEYQIALQTMYQQYGTEQISVEMNTDSSRDVHTIVVNGLLQWEDDDNEVHPLQYVKVEVWDDFYSTKLGTAYTDSSGFYACHIYDTASYRNIYVMIYPGGDYADAKSSNGGVYKHRSGVQYNVLPNSTVSISWSINMDNDMGRAFQIAQAVNVAGKYAETMNGLALEKINVVYPIVPETTEEDQQNVSPEEISRIEGAHYDEEEKTINIPLVISIEPTLPNSYAAWDGIMHEYGHHVMFQMDVCTSASYDGVNYGYINYADAMQNKLNGMRWAWREGYPTVFALMAQNYFQTTLGSIFTVGDTKYTIYMGGETNLETYNSSVFGDFVALGDACTLALECALWDIYDTSSESYDSLSYSHSAFWDLIMDSGATIFNEFVWYFNETQSESQKRALGSILSYYHISAYDLNCIIVGSRAAFTWELGGTSKHQAGSTTNGTYINDSFDLVFCDVNKNEILRIEYLPGGSYMLTTAQWATIMNATGSTFGFYVEAYQTDTPVTGYYQSEYITVAKPT